MKHKICIVSVLLVSQFAAGIGFSLPAHALSSGSGTMIEQGFDTCQDPTTSQTLAFWNGTPYYWIGTYIGGVDMGCSQPNLSSGWLNTVHGQGWQFEFIWVGMQPPNSGYINQFSTDPSTAYSQGQSEAANAVGKLENLGVTNSAQNTALVYDIEAVNGYQTAVNSFVQGWTNYLNSAPAQVPGVYGSVCGSNLVALASLSPPPTFIWGAEPNGNLSTSDLYHGGCGVPNGDWTNHQRLKQYTAGHNETHNGVTLLVDDDCANGPTDPSGGGTNNSCL